MERIVGRSELHSEDDSPSISSELEDIERLKELEHIDYVHLDKLHEDAMHQDETIESDAELDFRLFAGSNPTNTEEQRHVNKIRLHSPSIDSSTAGFIQPNRNPNYYFTQPLSHEEKFQFESAAMTAQQITAQARTPCPGNAYPWKVLHLPPSSLEKSIRSQEFRKLVDDAPSKGRTRPGKKYRIKLRRRHEAIRAQQEGAKAAAEAKEAAKREKKTRLNREKKVRKKLREKAKKAVGVEVDGPLSESD